MKTKIFVFPVLLTVLCLFGKISCENIEECGSVLPPDPNSYCCGVDVTSTNRIVGGKPTGLKQYPWLALVEYKHNRIPTYPVQPLCGAFLISSRYVVTAAHCVTGKDLESFTPCSAATPAARDTNKHGCLSGVNACPLQTGIRLGEYDITNPGQDCVYQYGDVDCTTAISIPIEKFMVHERYTNASKAANNYNDIALIKLKKLAPYTDHIRPICLPSTDFTVKSPPGLQLYVAGWGVVKQILTFSGYKDIYGPVKRHVAVPYVPYEKCRKVHQAITRSQICAGGGNHKESCKGDSGGPLMLDNDGVFEAVGVVSYGEGSPCGVRGIPSVYTNVFHFKQWIMEKIYMIEQNVW